LIGNTSFEHLGACTICGEPVFDFETGFETIATGYTDDDGEFFVDGEIVYCPGCAPPRRRAADMDERTLEALKRSIEKWETRVVLGAGYDGPVGASGCPLCQLHADGSGCFGCPVAQKVRQHGCHGTPYYDWRDALWDARRTPSLAPLVMKRAQAEVDFLKSLLPAQAGEAEGGDTVGGY